MTQHLSALEQVKATIDPYRVGEVLARLAGGTVEAITPEDDVVMRWHGLYRHRPLESGLFMLRIKLPGGALTAAQLRVIADIAEPAGYGVDLSMRQNVQFHRLSLAVLPAVFAALEAAGLPTAGACGDQVRGVVSCPLAGRDPDEPFDVRPTVRALTEAFLANPAFANLPRKFKIAVSGCGAGCVPVEINDLSFVAARNDAGEAGFALLAGGGLSAQPRLAEPLGVWVTPGEAVEVAGAAIAVFREHGNREHRNHARLKHLLIEHGVAWLREEMEAKLGRKLIPLAAPALPARRGEHLGVITQRDPALRTIGIPLPVGHLTVAQLRLLAELVEAYGQGQLAATNRQNLLLTDIPTAQLAAVLARLAKGGLPADAPWGRGLIACCTGKDFCTKALATTRGVARGLIEALAGELPPVTIGVSGCPNGCGQHAVAEIGLQGRVKREGDEVEERFDLWAGGGPGAIGRRIVTAVHPDALAAEIRGWLARYRTEAVPDESFGAFIRRTV